jgi:hypothetical protein
MSVSTYSLPKAKYGTESKTGLRQPLGPGNHRHGVTADTMYRPSSRQCLGEKCHVPSQNTMAHR